MFANAHLTVRSMVIRQSLERLTQLVVKLVCVVAITSLLTGELLADPPAAGKQKSAEPLIKIRTLGGTQFWTDQLILRGWRIQRNELTKHHRLLDNKNYRYTWGSFKHCQMTLEKLKTEKKIPPVQGKVVILLHGLGRTRNSMHAMGQYLQKHSDYPIVNIGYATSRARVQDHAQSLDQVISGLSRVNEISFVAHSLGNLVIRHYLKDIRKRSVPRPRLGRIVMLAPPNQGSKMAERFKGNRIVRTMWGLSGDEIALHWPRLSSQLAVPNCPFGIIAGKSELTVINNPLIDGNNDLVVTVEETRLAGADDFLVVPAAHSFLMDHPQVKAATLRFLQHGYFQSEAKRKPIESGPPGKP